jgi:hypothetical protein
VRVFEFNGGAWVQMGGDIDGEAADDYSGISVAMSSDGLTVAVGAYNNNGTAFLSGHVRVFAFPAPPPTSQPTLLPTPPPACDATRTASDNNDEITLYLVIIAVLVFIIILLVAYIFAGWFLKKRPQETVLDAEANTSELTGVKPKVGNSF